MKKSKNGDGEGFDEGDVAGYWGGEGKEGDGEIDRDPLSGKLRPEMKKSKNGDGEGFDEGDVAGYWGGEGKEGDGEIDRDPLFGKLRPEMKKSKNGDGYEEGLYGPVGRGKSEARDPYDGFEPERSNKAQSSLNKWGEISSSKDSHRRQKESELHELLGGGLTETKNSEPNLDDLDNKIIPRIDQHDDNPEDENFIIHSEEGKINLESGEVRVWLKYSLNGAEINQDCGFEDFFPNELAVIVPKECLPCGTSVYASIQLLYNGQERLVTASGNVSEVENSLPGKHSVTIALDEVDEGVYESFMNLYLERQSNIIQFMKLAKGYE